MSRLITFNFIIGTLLFCFVQEMLAKTFDTCELVLELRRQGFREDQLREWICLIEAESSLQTDAIGGPDDDGSYDFGLFQINDRYWCNNGASPGKGCNIRCSDLLLDNITIASDCAKKIYNQRGFAAWVGWNNECKGKKLPTIYC